uniref:ATP synthase subunit a n=1 Tax=Curculionoidea sp. 4 KM-2017 TaxID=2219417 RepID=A0A346RI77_9CUCU|nr:ATP synthase F0 subunit 6 [Curculionoidea sp. 4 KM-2017]
MMTNLFTSFDPTTLMHLSMNWLSSFMLFLLIPPMYWLIPSRYSMFWLMTNIFLYKELKILIKNKNFNGSTLFFCSLFIFILLNNFLGLFPYIFTSSSHMIFTLSLSLPLWLTFMLYGWMNKTIHMFTHLTPQGAPNILLPFLVIVETISNLIRPGTLAIRLSANMIAGHLLMTLMGNSGQNLTIFFLNILIISQILLLLLETAVSIIQSYVFSILATLYSSEIT